MYHAHSFQFIPFFFTMEMRSFLLEGLNSNLPLADGSLNLLVFGPFCRSFSRRRLPCVEQSEGLGNCQPVQHLQQKSCSKTYDAYFEEKGLGFIQC